MAFTLTLPLIGLEPRNFSALSTRLQCEIIEYQSPSVSGQDSPNATTSNEDKKNSYSTGKEKNNSEVRVTYEGRDILNLGANVRDPMWLKRDMWSGGYEPSTSNRSIAKKMEQPRDEDQTVKTCKDCNFRQPKPFLY